MKRDRVFIIKTIAVNGIIAALYAAITAACGPLSYEFMQLRFSELFNLLVFFNPWYTIGLTLGCLIANIFSSVGPIDIVFGTLTTLVACLVMVGYSKVIKNLFTTGLIPCLLNAIVVPFTIVVSTMGTNDAIPLTFANYFMMFGWVFLGEFVCINLIGYPIFLVLSKKYKGFYKSILATRNMDYKW